VAPAKDYAAMLHDCGAITYWPPLSVSVKHVGVPGSGRLLPTLGNTQVAAIRPHRRVSRGMAGVCHGRFFEPHNGEGELFTAAGVTPKPWWKATFRRCGSDRA
jgi:hypothetical protein